MKSKLKKYSPAFFLDLRIQDLFYKIYLSIFKKTSTYVDFMNTTASSHENQSAHEKPAESNLECNICFEDSTEPVTTTCGHIYW